jgi:hypothetical protein
MKIIYFLCIFLKYTLTANPSIFNIDGDSKLKLSSFFSSMTPFEYNIRLKDNYTIPISIKTNANLQLNLTAIGDFDIPKLEMYDSAALPVNYSLMVKPCETCLTFDYVQNYTAPSGIAQCELNHNEMSYNTVKDYANRAQLDVKKNLYTIFDFMLTNDDKVYVTISDNQYDEISGYIDDTDFHAESSSIRGIYTYNSGDSVNLVFNCDKHIYVFDLTTDVDDQVTPILTLKDKIKKDKLSNINNDDIEQITGDALYTRYYIFVKKGEAGGIHILYMSSDKSDYVVSYLSSVTFFSEKIDLNIVNVYCPRSELNTPTF